MEYSRFRKLVAGGEKQTVDFKIKCDAFGDGGQPARAELAKDICALANNGGQVSYMVIGVSDDACHFRSVDNDRLTDDNLQDFCKHSVFPPPKVKIHRSRWTRVDSAHTGMTFVIIQVGPNQRQVFRLAQDQIDYPNKKCYRRNEVWIRRESTSDLATPEEIVRLASGQSLHQVSEEHLALRERFSRLSLQEQREELNVYTQKCLRRCGYLLEQERDRAPARLSHRIEPRIRWKVVDRTAIIVTVGRAAQTHSMDDLRALARFGFVPDGFPRWEDMPRSIRKEKDIRAIRRVLLLPVVDAVPRHRMSRVFPDVGTTELAGHYHRFALGPRYRGTAEIAIPEIPSSSELLVVSSQGSSQDYCDALVQALGQLELLSVQVMVKQGKPR